MAFKQDSWTISYDACEKLSREIMEQIAYRNQQGKNSIASSKASAHARKLIKKYDVTLESLKQTLMASRPLLIESEFERRQRLIDDLFSKKTQIDFEFNDRGEGSNRQALLGADLGAHSLNVWDIEETETTKNLSVNEIRDQQKYAIQEQDKGLDSLFDTVVRQKQLAQNINQELDLHNEIIEDIVDHADSTRQRLLKETRHVTIVDRKSGTCAYWSIILLLFIAIVIVAAI